jgi:ATP-binding cassette subfamily F protein 3
MDGRREEMLVAKDELEAGFASGSADEEALTQYGRILEELDLLDEYRLESRAQEILMGMGFKTSDFHRGLVEFSGGWLMRIALCRILLMQPDLLLLDEPTNHLDLESLLWLEEFLIGYRGAILLVSHDSAFLNRVVEEVIEIDQKKLWTYRGNLDSYAAQKQERMTVLRAQYEGQQAKIAEIQAFVTRFGAKATKARQAQSRLKQLEKMDRIELPDSRPTVRFRFPPAAHSGKEVVRVREAEIAYGQKKIFSHLNWSIPRGARIAVVGVNGAGKTTLLKAIGGLVAPSQGEVKLGHEVKVGYYSQFQSESLDLKKTVLEELETAAPHLPISQVRGIAGAFLFTGDLVNKPCGVLSGGEKARVALAKLLLCPSNFLILDEPTNHLDVDSREVLLKALQGYEGSLCLVSHDRAFVSPLVTSVLEIIPNESSDSGSEVVQLLVSYQEYLQRKIQEATGRLSVFQEKAPDKPTKPGSAPSDHSSTVTRKTPSNNQKRTWERERDRLEAEISQHEKRQNKLQETLSNHQDLLSTQDLNQLIQEKVVLDQKLATCLIRWEELCNLLQLS